MCPESRLPAAVLATGLDAADLIAFHRIRREIVVRPTEGTEMMKLEATLLGKIRVAQAFSLHLLENLGARIPRLPIHFWIGGSFLREAEGRRDMIPQPGAGNENARRKALGQ